MASKGIKGITIEISGETTGLQKALADVNKRSRDLTAELKEVDRGLKFNPGNADLIAQKQALLAETVGNTTEKLNRLKSAQHQVDQQFQSGAINAEQYRAFQREVAETEGKLSTFEGQLQTSQGKIEKFGTAMKTASDKMKTAGEGIKNAGSSMSGFVTAPLVGGLALATKGTEELREDMARLEQNARDAGIGTDEINAALVRLSGVTGETDSNVEALSNLLATGFDEQGMLTAMDSLSGAVIKFPDTLNIEGLADGLQETMATGKAIGPFAELLERMGVDLETFDEGLAGAAASGKEQDYILQALADTGLSKVNEQYRINNEELVKSSESSATFQQAMADLGATLAPIMTAVTDLITKVIEKFNELSPSAQKTVLVIAGIAAAIGPFLLVAGTLIKSVGSMIGLFTKISPIIAGVAGPIAIAIAAVAALVAIGILLYKNWDTVKAYAVKIWNSVKEFFSTTMDSIKTTMSNAWNSIKSTTSSVFNSIKGTITSIWNGIKTGFNTTITAIINFVKTRWENLKSNTSSVFNAVKSTITNIWNGIKSFVSSAVGNMVSTVRNKFQEIVSAAREKMNDVLSNIKRIWGNVKSFFQGINLYSMGRDIIQGLINGVKGMATSLVNSVKGVVDGAIEGAKNLLGINSPSKVFMEIGEFSGEGLAIGIDSMMKAVSKAGQSLADSAIPVMQKPSQISQPSQVVQESRGPVIIQSILNGRVIAEEIFPDMNSLMANDFTTNTYLKGIR